MTTLAVQVAGMTCAACERSIDAAVGQPPGVIEVQADARTGGVIVTSSNAISPELIRVTIESAGFDVLGTLP